MQYTQPINTDTVITSHQEVKAMRYPNVALLFFLLTLCLTVEAQARYTELTRKNLPDGSLSLQTYNPRPVYQVSTLIAQLSRALIDYEDPIFPESMGHTLQIRIPKISDRESLLKSLARLTTDSKEQTGVSFLTLLHSSSERIDVVGQNSNGSTPFLSTSITLPKKTRTLDATINEILSRVSQVTGVKVVRGGLVNSALSNRTITLGTNKITPARDLLSLVLDATDDKMVWVLGYEAGEHYYAIAFQSASN